MLHSSSIGQYQGSLGECKGGSSVPAGLPLAIVTKLVTEVLTCSMHVE